MRSSRPWPSASASTRHAPALLALLADEPRVSPDTIRDFELSLFDVTPAALGGGCVANSSTSCNLLFSTMLQTANPCLFSTFGPRPPLALAANSPCFHALIVNVGVQLLQFISTTALDHCRRKMPLPTDVSAHKPIGCP